MQNFKYEYQATDMIWIMFTKFTLIGGLRFSLKKNSLRLFNGFKTSLFDDFTIDIREVFEDIEI